MKIANKSSAPRDIIRAVKKNLTDFAIGESDVVSAFATTHFAFHYTIRRVVD